MQACVPSLWGMLATPPHTLCKGDRAIFPGE